MMNFQDNIEQAKAHDLREFVSQFLDVKRAGANYVSLCPFHDEKTPSFTVYKHRSKCFGCGWSGDILDFAQNYHKISLAEAIEMITGEKVTKTSDSQPQTIDLLTEAEMLDKLWSIDAILTECIAQHCQKNRLDFFNYIQDYPLPDRTTTTTKNLLKFKKLIARELYRTVTDDVQK